MASALDSLMKRKGIVIKTQAKQPESNLDTALKNIQARRSSVQSQPETTPFNIPNQPPFKAAMPTPVTTQTPSRSAVTQPQQDHTLVDTLKSAGHAFIASGTGLISGVGAGVRSTGHNMQYDQPNKESATGKILRTVAGVAVPAIGAANEIKKIYDETGFTKNVNKFAGPVVEKAGSSVEKTYGDVAKKIQKDPRLIKEYQSFNDENGNFDPKKLKNLGVLLNVGASALGSYVPLAAANMVTGGGAAGIATGAVLMGIAEKGDAVQQYEQEVASRQGVSPEQLSEKDKAHIDEMANYYGIASGILESAFPAQLEKIIGSSAKQATKSLFKKIFFRTPVEMLRSIMTEGGTEGVQRFTQNAIAKLSEINPDQKLSDGVIDEAIAGALMGMGVSATTTLGAPSGTKINPMEVQNKGPLTTQESRVVAPTPPPAPAPVISSVTGTAPVVEKPQVISSVTNTAPVAEQPQVQSTTIDEVRKAQEPSGPLSALVTAEAIASRNQAVREEVANRVKMSQEAPVVTKEIVKEPIQQKIVENPITDEKKAYSSAADALNDPEHLIVDANKKVESEKKSTVVSKKSGIQLSPNFVEEAKELRKEYDAKKKAEEEIMSDPFKVASAKELVKREKKTVVSKKKPTVVTDTSAEKADVFTGLENDIPFDVARMAHEGTSFDPEKRAKSRIDDYVDTLKSDYADLLKLADTEEKKSILDEKFSEYREGYKEREISLMNAESRQISPMISGAANFPVARNRKRMEAADKRRTDVIEFRKKSLKRIESAINPNVQQRTSGTSKEAISAIGDELSKLKATQEKMKEANRIVRSGKNVESRLSDLGYDESAIKAILTPDFAGRVGFPSYELTSINNKIKNLESKEKIASQKREKADTTGNEVFVSGDVKIVKNFDDDRVQILFPGKPSSEMIASLKGRGFRWSPSNQAWQRQLTNKAVYDAKNIVGYKEEEEKIEINEVPFSVRRLSKSEKEAQGAIERAVADAIVPNDKWDKIVGRFGRTTADFEDYGAISDLRDKIKKDVKSIDHAEYRNVYEILGSRFRMSLGDAVMREMYDEVYSVKRGADPLYAEALKYESAEEFVKAQNLYHGTNAKLDGDALSFGKGAGAKKGGHSGGLFLSDKPEVSSVFGENVYHASPEIKKQVIDLTQKDGISKFKSFVGKKYKTFEGDEVEFTEYDFDAMFPGGKADFASISQYPELVEKIVKENNLRGVAFSEYAGGKIGKTYQILEGDIPVKTKSQLTDIWNEAHSGMFRTSSSENVADGQAAQFDRGADGVKLQLFTMVKAGQLSEADYQGTIYVLDKVAPLIKNLGLYTGGTASDSGVRGAGGEYIQAAEIVHLYNNILKEGNSDGIKKTFFHEVGHHLERYIPKKMADEIRAKFDKERAEAIKKNPELEGASLEWFDKHEELYRYKNISEYVAEMFMEMSEKDLAKRAAYEKMPRGMKKAFVFLKTLFRHIVVSMRIHGSIEERVYQELTSGKELKEERLFGLHNGGMTIDQEKQMRDGLIYDALRTYGNRLSKEKQAIFENMLDRGLPYEDHLKIADAIIRSGVHPGEFRVKNRTILSLAREKKAIAKDTLTSTITPKLRDEYEATLNKMAELVQADMAMAEAMSGLPVYFDEKQNQYENFVDLFKKYPQAREVLQSSDTEGIKDRLEKVMPRTKVDDIFYTNESEQTADDVLEGFRDTLSKQNPNLFYGKKTASALGKSKDSVIDQTIRNLENENGSQFSSEYRALKTTLDSLTDKSRGFQEELARQVAEGPVDMRKANLARLGVVIPKRRTIVSKVSTARLEKAKAREYTAGVKKGFNIGAKTGYALMKDLASDREKTLDQRKKTVRDYAVEMLPLQARGGLLTSVASAKTEKDVMKAFSRIETLAEKYRKKALISELKKTVKKVIESNSIDIGYKERIMELVGGIELKDKRRSTIDRLLATKEYIARQIASGVEPVMPEHIKADLESLGKRAVSTMSEADIVTLLSEIEHLSELGKTKLYVRRQVYELRKDRLKQELVENSKPIESHKEIQRLEGTTLSTTEKLKNVVTKTVNFSIKTDKYISPVDVVFDILDGSQGFVGSNYRLFKRNLDIRFGQFLDMKDARQNPVKEFAESHKMDHKNFERIGVYAASVQEGGMEKLANNGLTKEFVHSIQLTSDEMTLYTMMRNAFESLRPETERIVRELYNRPLGKVENYFSFMTDFNKETDIDVIDRLVDSIERGNGKTKTVEQGHTIERKGPGKQKIKTNAMEIFIKHTENASYLISMGEEIKMLSEIANSPEYRESVGDIGASLVTEWLDTMARKGGLLGEQQIALLDKLRVNLGAAVLGLKLSSALIQPTALFNGAALIGNYAFKGAYNITDKGWQDFLYKNFPELRDRMGDDPSYLESGFKALETVQKAGYAPLQKLDVITASAIAAGAYEKYADEHGITVDFANPNKDGIVYAQLKLRRTQSSAFFKDSPLSITRGKVFNNRSISRAFFQFQSFTLNTWSMIRHEGIRIGIQQGHYGQAARIGFWTGVSSLSAVAIRQGVKQAIAMITGDDDKEKKSIAEQWLRDMLGYIPFLSQGMSMLSYGEFPVPSLSIVGDATTAYKQLGGKKADTKVRGFINAAATVGQVAGIPGTMQAAQILTSLTYKKKSGGVKLIKK